MYSLVPTDTQWGGIYETDSGTCPQQYGLYEYDQREKHFFFQFNKAVVRYPTRKQMC